MAITRRGQPKPLEQQELAWRVGEMILASEHMRNVHQRIIERIGKEKSRCAVGPADDEITDDGRPGVLLAVHDVIEHDVASGRYAKTQRRGLAGIQTASRLARGEFRTGTGVTWRPARGLRRGTLGGQLLAAAKAGLGGVFAIQRLEVLCINGCAFALSLRS